MSTLQAGSPALALEPRLPEDIPTVRNRVVFQDVPQEAINEPAASAADRLKHALDQLPVVGQRFAGFELVAVLGRGTFGRVYLASQGDLADRFVALKISPDLTGESRTLARLQHTNIVPIYSVHRVDSFHAVCMPFFGATTLGHLLARYRGRATLPSTGRQLVDTLCLLNDETNVRPPETPGTANSLTGGSPVSAESGLEQVEDAPARPPTLPDRPRTRGFLALLRGMSYTDAVCWVGSQLADGLAHAHGLGVVHNDLKPANVLLTDAGQPMLLDFGVADDLAHRTLARSIGGTLPYMSPEHMESTRSLIPVTDPRSDVYGLGLILFEMLTGRHPFRLPTGSGEEELSRMLAERRTGPPAVRPHNPSVSPGLEAIVRKCLEPDPARRYQSAADLREDLERHRSHRPLLHVRVPSMRERLTKWGRRHPRLSSNLTLAIASVIVIGLLCAGLYAREARAERYKAEAAIHEARVAAQALDDDVRVAHYLLTVRADDPSQIGAAVVQCESALARFGLPSDGEWDRHPTFLALPSDEQQRVRDRLTEGCALLARGYGMLAQPGNNETEQIQRAVRMSEFAELVAGAEAPRAVWEQRASLLRRQGKAGEADQAAARAGSAPLRTGRDYFLSGSEALVAGRHRDALSLLTRAVELDPGSYDANLALGACYDRLTRYSDAAACYTTAIALWPDKWWGYYNRGLAVLKRGDYQKARTDFNRAADLAPDRNEIYLHRAYAVQYLGDYPPAIRDLDRALELGASKARVVAMRAKVWELAGDKEAAKRDLDEAARLEPTDEVTWVARGYARLGTDLPGALKDFEGALAVNPRSLGALQNKSHVLSKLGRTDEAIQVLDRILDLYPDYVKGRAGRGVMHARAENWAAAKADAEDALRRDSSPSNVYQIAGIYARLTQNDSAHKAEAIRLLSTALRAGFGYEYVETDKDLDPIRDTSEFRRVLDGVRALKGQ
jgi:serine/threonine protein kinase/tetratricopeptide (TPR) repeat protein